MAASTPFYKENVDFVAILSDLVLLFNGRFTNSLLFNIIFKILDALKDEAGI